MMVETRTKIRVCSTEDVDFDTVIRVEIDNLALAVYNVDGIFFVTDDACTHGPGSLSEGELSGHIIECDFHYGAFDIRSGDVVAPPCMVPLRTYKVIMDGNEVFIEA